MSPAEKTAEERWRALGEIAQHILSTLSRFDDPEHGYNGTFYAVESESEEVRAAIAHLLLVGLIEANQVPNGPIVYRPTADGNGLVFLGRPEDPEQERETKRVSKYLSEHSEVDPFSGRIRRKRKR